MKRRLDPIFSNSDRQILTFLWKHRLSTFQTLRTVFFPCTTNLHVYYRLRRLWRGRYIKMEKIDGTNQRIFRLDQRGFQYLETNCLPELKFKGYKPQRHVHDLFVLSALLGDWYRETPPGVRIVSEQELAATEIPELPLSLRKDLSHMPDGLWIFSDGKEQRTVALEVEISAKSNSRYEQICAFYGGELFFSNVVWIVANKGLGNRILEASRRYGIPREGLHLFIGQEEFKKRQWQSEFLNASKKDMSLSAFLSDQVGSESSVQSRIHAASTSNPGRIQKSEMNHFFDFKLSLEESIICDKKGTFEKL